jgi:hypothetical protein
VLAVVAVDGQAEGALVCGWLERQVYLSVGGDLRRIVDLEEKVQQSAAE